MPTDPTTPRLPTEGLPNPRVRVQPAKPPTADELRARIAAHKQHATKPVPPAQPAPAPKPKEQPKSATTAKPAGVSQDRPKKATLPESARKDNRVATKGRLPHGSVFAVTYDDTARQWSGTLAIPGVDVPFTGSARGVFALLEMLDDQYRAWKVKQAVEKGKESQGEAA